ncbi:hypothetical protein MKX01_009703 [Papaver californicum]|nr:hypothetical protein MKX01_009703 [Papaver californicum]
MLANIDLRCRDTFASSETFRNVSIVLVDDLRQLPPVFDTPLYAQGGRDTLQLAGFLSYSVFEHCVRLEEVFRQSEVEESLFRDILVRLGDGRSTLQDWKLFNTRDYTMLTVEEKNNFKHALRLFPTKSGVAGYNHKRLKKILLLSKGARVMLRKNLSTQHDLVNGSTGIVMDIVYAIWEKLPIDMHVVVMVDFDKYIDPKLYPRSNLDMCFRCNMPTDSITTYFVLGNHGSQRLGIDT